MQGNFTKDKKPTLAHPKEVDTLQQSVSSLMASLSEDKKSTIQFLVDLVREFKKDTTLTEDAREVKVVNQLVLTHKDYLKKLITKDTTTIEELGSIVDLSGLDLSTITKNLKLTKTKILSMMKRSVESVKVDEKIEVKYKPKVKTLYKILENKIAGEQYFKNVTEFCEKRIDERMEKEIDDVSRGDPFKNIVKNDKKQNKKYGNKTQVSTRKNITKQVMKIGKPKSTGIKSPKGGENVVLCQVGMTLKTPSVKSKRQSIPNLGIVNGKNRKYARKSEAKVTIGNDRKTKNIVAPVDSIVSVAKNKKTTQKTNEAGTVGKGVTRKKQSEIRSTEPSRFLGFVPIPSFNKKKAIVESEGSTPDGKDEGKSDSISFKSNFLIGFNSTQKFIQSTMLGLLKKIPGMILRGVLTGAKWTILNAIKLVCPVAGIILKLVKPFMFLLRWVGKGAKIAFHAIGKALSFSFGIIKKTIGFVTVGWIKGLFGIHKKIMKMLKSNIVKKIVGFLFSPKGAFILGFIVGFLYKHVYVPIKNNWDKIKRSIKKAYLATKTTLLRSILTIGDFYNDTFLPGYEKIQGFINDLDTEKIDQMALDFKVKIYYPIMDVFDFLKESVMQVPSLAGSSIGAAVGSVFGPIGTIAGGVIGGLIGGLVTDAFGDKFKEEIDERTKKENKERDIVASYGFSEKTNRRKNIIAEAMKRRDRMSDDDLKKNSDQIDKLQKMQDANKYFMNSDDEENLIPEDFDIDQFGKQINDELVDTKTQISKGALDKGLAVSQESKIPLPGNKAYKGQILNRYVRAILLSRMYNWFRDGIISKWNLYTYYRDMFNEDGDFSESIRKETLNTYTTDQNTGRKIEKRMTVDQVLSGDFYSFKDKDGNKILNTSGLIARGQILNMETETHDQAKVSDQFIKDQVEGVISKYYGVVFEGIPKEDIPEATEILRSFLIKSYNSGRWKLGDGGKLLFTEQNAKEVNENMKNLFQTLQIYNETLQSHKFVHMPNLGRVDMTQIRNMYESSSKELDKMLEEDKAKKQEKERKTEDELNSSGNIMVKKVIGTVTEKVKNKKDKQSIVVENNSKNSIFAAV